MHSITAIYITVLILLFSSHINSKDKGIRPSIKQISEFKVIEYNTSGIRASALLTVTNNNSFNLKCTDVSFVILYQGDELLISEKKLDFTLHAKKDDTIRLMVLIPEKIISSKVDSLLNKDSILTESSVKGKFSKLRIKKEDKFFCWINVGKILDGIANDYIPKKTISINQLHLKKIELTNSVIGVDIKFDNKLPFNFKIKKIELEVFNDNNFNKKVGKSLKEESIEVLQNESKDIQIDIKIDNISTFTGLFSKSTKLTEYYSKGKMTTLIRDKEFSIPFHFNFNLNLTTKEIDLIK